jgi:mono/diheme cytochrome c family protein
MTVNSKWAAAAVVAGLCSIQGALVAQQAKTSWDGVYSEAQATRGKAVWAEACASCHGAELAGGDMGPGLAGRDFLTNWNDLSVGDLYDRIRTSMPQNAPGSLKAEQNADVLAFILQKNGFPAGAQDLAAQGDALKKINILAAKP